MTDTPSPPTGMPGEEDWQMLERLGDRADRWAAEFRKTAIKLGYSDMDEGWLIGWFANAIESRPRSLSPAAGDTIEGVRDPDFVPKPTPQAGE